MKAHNILLTFILLSLAPGLLAQDVAITKWNCAELLQAKDTITIIGNPTLVDAPIGSAALFNGNSDGIFLQSNPLIGLQQYTLEVIFSPQSGGEHEQRFLHFGELRGNRALLEIRVFEDSWVLDAFVKAGTNGLTLIDTTRRHPLNEWYHCALVLDSGKVTAYIDGKKELEGALPSFQPQTDKNVSIGVRLNRQYWFKGAIASISITPTALEPSSFHLLQSVR